MENRDEGEKTEQPGRRDELARPPGSLRRQFIGSLIGAAIAMVIFLLSRQLGWLGGELVQYLLWGAVVGGLIGGSDALAQAGKRLTKRDEDWLNILVSLVAMAVIVGMLFALSSALTTLLQNLFPR
ncbi:MAG: hypothetical protein JXC32_07575 [Anaerolineae bacterium]|nr:hypothetical protein [Anaerolineae bacterium]